MKPLRSHEPFVQALAKMENPLLGLLGGALFTGLVQSSAATVGLAIALASEGLLTLPAGIALALGANIGTCVTALLAALGKPAEAVRAAVVHVGFNAVGVLIWLPFIGLLARLAVAISPESAGFEGAEKLAVEVPRQIANANTLFNVINTVLFIGFTGWFARLATRLVRERKPEDVLITPEFLDPASLDVPAIALENVRQELGRLGDIVRTMLVDFPPERGAVTTDTIANIFQLQKRLEILESAVIEFLARIRQGNLPRAESETHIALMSAAIHFRSMADIVADDLARVAQAAAEGEIQSGTLKRTVLSECYQSVQRAVELAVEAVRRPNARIEDEMEIISDQVNTLAESLMSQVAVGLDAGDPKSLTTVRLQTIFVDGLRQISSLARRIVRGAITGSAIDSSEEATAASPAALARPDK